MKLQGRNLSLKMRGDDVALLHRELALIGLTVSDAERRNKRFGQGTQVALKRFQQEHRMEPTGVVDAETARAINAAVDAVTFAIKGKVFSGSRAGVGGLRVVIVDKNVGEEVPLAEAVTDDGGSYQARFTLDDLRKRGKQQPDLQARVLAGRKFLGASEVRYNASPRETLNVLLSGEASAALSAEYETLTRDLSK